MKIDVTVSRIKSLVILCYNYVSAYDYTTHPQRDAIISCTHVYRVKSLFIICVKSMACNKLGARVNTKFAESRHPPELSAARQVPGVLKNTRLPPYNKLYSRLQGKITVYSLC